MADIIIKNGEINVSETNETGNLITSIPIKLEMMKKTIEGHNIGIKIENKEIILPALDEFGIKTSISVKLEEIKEAIEKE